MYDCIQYDPIQGQKSEIRKCLKTIFSDIYYGGWRMTKDS